MLFFVVHGDCDRLLVADDPTSYDTVAQWIAGVPPDASLEIWPILHPLLIAIPLLLLGALTTGISSWQADRLTITPLYIGICAFILHEVVLAVKRSTWTVRSERAPGASF